MANKRKADNDSRPRKRGYHLTHDTQRIVEALVGFRPEEPIGYHEWLNQLEMEGTLGRIAHSLGLKVSVVRKKYQGCHLHQHHRLLARDVSSPQYWDLWKTMYRWSSVEDAMRRSRADYGLDESHSETEESPEESDAISTASLMSEKPDEVSGVLGSPRAVTVCKYKNGYGTLTELRYNAETLTAELYLPGSSQTPPKIHPTSSNNLLIEFGNSRVVILTASNHTPVKVSHEIIQVAADREPIFLHIRVVYEKLPAPSMS